VPEKLGTFGRQDLRSCAGDVGMSKADLTVLKRSPNFAAIRECSRLWREQHSRAIEAGDANWAEHAEKCAQRFEAYLVRERPTPRIASSCPSVDDAMRTDFGIQEDPALAVDDVGLEPGPIVQACLLSPSERSEREMDRLLRTRLKTARLSRTPS
jgi:hypothetical protein